ncbi:MAG TPA: hypothetical protein VHV08_09320, partial [Pirellulales bacterium]|nr:hypothetical protein [Pirellulales bacterium]
MSTPIPLRPWCTILLLAWGSLTRGLPLAAEEPSQGTALPLNRVVLFNSGVGYFEHRGQVDGDAHIDLRFRVDDINDLLKSMVLEDRGGGTISTVTYGSRDPITKTLKTFPVDLTNNPTLGQILDQVRGERVQVEAPNAIAGVLLGIEKRKKEVGTNHDTIDAEFLNLLTDEGLRSVPLDSVSRIKLTNEKLDGELRQALEVLARGHNTDKKTVSLSLLGQGKRMVRVAYIQEMPIWKTSYRLVLDDNGMPFLQGWAIVENTTEDDWKSVALTLVSGRPISYRMDLYEPLYIQRPLEHVELFASLRPQTYGQDLATPPPGEVAGVELQLAPAPAASPAAKSARDLRGGMGGLGGGRGKTGVPADSAQVRMKDSENERLQVTRNASASAGDVGELFQYVIAAPVKLARQ